MDEGLLESEEYLLSRRPILAQDIEDAYGLSTGFLREGAGFRLPHPVHSISIERVDILPEEVLWSEWLGPEGEDPRDQVGGLDLYPYIYRVRMSNRGSMPGHLRWGTEALARALAALWDAEGGLSLVDSVQRRDELGDIGASTMDAPGRTGAEALAVDGPRGVRRRGPALLRGLLLVVFLQGCLAAAWALSSAAGAQAYDNDLTLIDVGVALLVIPPLVGLTTSAFMRRWLLFAVLGVLLAGPPLVVGAVALAHGRQDPGIAALALGGLLIAFLLMLPPFLRLNRWASAGERPVPSARRLSRLTRRWRAEHPGGEVVVVVVVASSGPGGAPMAGLAPCLLWADARELRLTTIPVTPWRPRVLHRQGAGPGVRISPLPTGGSPAGELSILLADSLGAWVVCVLEQGPRGPRAVDAAATREWSRRLARAIGGRLG